MLKEKHKYKIYKKNMNKTNKNIKAKYVKYV